MSALVLAMNIALCSQLCRRCCETSHQAPPPAPEGVHVLPWRRMMRTATHIPDSEGRREPEITLLTLHSVSLWSPWILRN